MRLRPLGRLAQALAFMVRSLGMFLVFALALHSASANECVTLDKLPGTGTFKQDDCASSASPGSDVTYSVRCRPAYPSAAVREHLEGTVILKVRVSEAGGAISASVATPSPYAVLNEAALRFVRSGEFPLFFPPNRSTPACYDILYPVDFKLKEL